jgi:hypothetical protein
MAWSASRHALPAKSLVLILDRYSILPPDAPEGIRIGSRDHEDRAAADPQLVAA